MKIAKFDAAGGPIEAEVTCTPNRNGSYRILLWEAGVNQVVKKYPGNFLNPDDDSYGLDAPTSSHNGRLVEALVTVAIPSGVGPSLVKLAIAQDGQALGDDSASVPPGSPGTTVDLFIKLEAK